MFLYYKVFLKEMTHFTLYSQITELNLNKVFFGTQLEKNL
jgi:hypothetical protein